MPRDELPPLLRSADALLSATQPRGSETLDKVVYEAAACGVPVLASNTALDELLGACRSSSASLRGTPTRSRTAARTRCRGARGAGRGGAELRRRVVANHSLESWVDGVAAAVTDQTRE